MFDNQTPNEAEKCFIFKAKVIATIEGYVFAKTAEEADKYIKEKEFDEMEKFEIEEIDYILELKEE